VQFWEGYFRAALPLSRFLCDRVGEILFFGIEVAIYNRNSQMNAARISELLQPFLARCHSDASQSEAEEPAFLSAAQLQSISTYIDILQRWNSRINLTAIRDEEQIVTRHFGESLFAASNLFPRSNREGHGFSSEPALSEPSESKGANSTSHNEEGASAPEVADIGSGAGFPGIPIKLWAPHIHLTLVESNHKKATFLREATRVLTLTDINILNARAESISTKFDVVTLRAVERFETILPIAASLLAPFGRLALLIGSAQADGVRAALPALTWSDPYPIPASDSRILLVGKLQPEPRI
jgi:16S rRNA (guanine527-N7)-methyltransferase